MSKERQAQILTVLVLAAALGVAYWRKLPQTAAARGDGTPQDAIYAMLDAARDGDVKGYVAAHTGQMAVALAKAVSESGAEGFQKYLRETNAPIKGIAVQEPQTLTDREVKVRVEYVYQDRNEVQYMYLEKGAGGWKIARVEGAERVKTLVPYGTPVN